MAIGNWNPAFYDGLMRFTDDMRAVAVELWNDEPNVLIPWLEEFVILSKSYEDFIAIRAAAGNEPPQNMHRAQFHRLAAEAALWKAKNAQRQGGK